jgi:hypothetical protein
MLDTLFELGSEFIESQQVNEWQTSLHLRRDVKLWLVVTKTEYVFSLLSNFKAIIHITDRKKAAMFKLRWL